MIQRTRDKEKSIFASNVKNKIRGKRPIDFKASEKK